MPHPLSIASFYLSELLRIPFSARYPTTDRPATPAATMMARLWRLPVMFSGWFAVSVGKGWDVTVGAAVADGEVSPIG
jgi:hypothetical protein